jgi:alpha-ketoglutarate-dependent taurine dioxygenase
MKITNTKEKKMIKIVPIEFPGLEELKNNFDFYKNKLIEDSVVAFRNANISLEDQKELHKTLGDLFGWETREGGWNYYQENHSHNPSINTAQKDEILLGWHMEHVYYNTPIIASTWNMSTFNVDSSVGKTYFFDTQKIYSSLDEDSQNFLSKCRLNSSNFNLEQPFIPYDLVQDHWLTKEKVIRLPIGGDIFENLEILDSFDGEKPSLENNNKFKTLASSISRRITDDESSRLVHEWKQGDLLLVDIFRLAHAVTGGFEPKDREFTGIWGWKKIDGPNKHIDNGLGWI